MSLPGRTALITGAGGGVGSVMARLFQAEGARVVGVDKDESALRQLREDTSVEVVAADISSPEGVEHAVDSCDGHVDILCNTAGVLDRLGLVDEVSLDEWHRLMAVNLTGPFLLCRRVVPGMLERGRGVIVNVASVAGLRGGRAGAAYTASKFGLVGLTMNIAATYGNRGVRCNAICPGGIDTNMARGGVLTEAGRQLGSRDRDRPPRAQPEQVAAVAVMLARDESSYINGAALPVDGGWIAF